MHQDENSKKRFYAIIAVLLLFVLLLLWRLIDLSVFDRSFLLQQSDSRAMRVIATPAYRGMITDRNGISLAISTPVDSAWINPSLFQPTQSQLSQLSKLLGMPISAIKKRDNNDSDREFVYLKREIPPDLADQIKAMNIAGLNFQREYRRYYPEGEVATHVVGYTNIDDVGEEGIELGFDKILRGVPGKERVLKDRLGHIIAIMNVISEPQQGKDLPLSIDERIQFLAYKNLQDAVTKFNADGGSVVVMNPKTGEILAMANLPSYNPNVRPLIPDSRFRNRAVTDVYEPGSVMKTFSVYTALASGKYSINTNVDTSPGVVFIDGHPIHDAESHQDILSLTQVLQFSSNIGIAKIILTLPVEQLLSVLHASGFGESTHSGFPGEVAGSLVNHPHWSQIDQATVSFGYGLSVTPLQLAHAYADIANDGIDVTPTFLKQTAVVPGKRVLDPKITAEVLAMLETVIQKGGSGTQAQIPGYIVAGKTGTAYIATPGGYIKDRYNSSFVGIVPVSNPQLVVAISLYNVKGGVHFGGQVAAPTFANIASAALRLLSIPPDNLSAVNANSSNVAATNVASLNNNN